MNLPGMEGKHMLPIALEPIPHLDREQPLRALSLPAWLQRCVNALTADFLKPTLPTELMLSSEQRIAIEVRIDELSEAELACDVDHTMAVVVELLEGFPAAKLSEDQARLKSKAYITALEGIATWAVAEATRRWLQAKAGSQNYDFAPSPPRLREVADQVLAELRAQRIQLRRLLRATADVPIDHDPETRAQMTRKFKELQADLKSANRWPAFRVKFGVADANEETTNSSEQAADPGVAA
jgi:hypothetical protein